MTAFNCELFSKGIQFRREPLFVEDDASISLNHFYIPQHYQDTLSRILVPHGMIVDRVEKLAYDIAQDYEGYTIHMLCVLKGLIVCCKFESF
jgi:hypoxanthine phosphoribosyltransferase